jgi:AcrR family transcriptional regulator
MLGVLGMVRQARSEATRRRIINAAVDVFSEMGYPASGLGDIIERADMTKGALYYHFDSKEALATAIIEEGGDTLFRAFQGIDEPSAPALETMIHGLFVAADVIATDKVVRTGAQLLRAFGEFNEVAAPTYGRMLGDMMAQARQASAEGDLRAGLEPEVAAETIVGALLGAELISDATCGGADLIPRVERMWSVLLPAIASEGSLPYFREFLARESLRHSPTLSIDAAADDS